jgi:clathrin heavy chain
MARKSIKDQKIDSELIYAYAKNGERFLPELESFVSEPNQADSQKCGDRCFDDKLFMAAEILYKRVGNNQKLAQVYVKLKKYQDAFVAARKADVPKVWKAVCFACVRAKEFRMAALCGQHVIIQPDHLEDVLAFYEKFGYVDELTQLMEVGMSLERTHNGIYTELGIIYAKYAPKRLMDHIRTYNNKLMIPKLIRACEQYQMWPEAVHLHSSYEQQDQAIITMMEHSPSSWRHGLFC